MTKEKVTNGKLAFTNFLTGVLDQLEQCRDTLTDIADEAAPDTLKGIQGVITVLSDISGDLAIIVRAFSTVAQSNKQKGQ